MTGRDHAPIKPETLAILDGILSDDAEYRAVAAAFLGRGIEALRTPRVDRVQIAHGVPLAADELAYAQQIAVQPLAGDVNGGGLADVRSPKTNRTSAQKSAAKTKRTRNATQKVLDYLSEHESDTILSTDTLWMKLRKEHRIRVGRSSVGKALGIARANGRS